MLTLVSFFLSLGVVHYSGEEMFTAMGFDLKILVGVYGGVDHPQDIIPCPYLLCFY